MEVKIFTPIITIVLNEPYTEFFKQVCKVGLLNTEQGHRIKVLVCVSLSVVYHLKLSFFFLVAIP